MTIKSKISRTLAMGLIGLSCLAGKVQAQDKIHGNIGYIQSEKGTNSYTEANVLYSLPLEIKGYTFLDFYNNKGGFYGKTSLTKEFVKNISARFQTVHANETFSETGLGLEAKFPKMADNFSLKLNCMPLWFNSEGQEDNNVKLGYCLSLNLPKDTYLSSFGEWNLANKKGPTWTYGEVELGKKLGNINLAYNAALKFREAGESVPDLEHRVALRINF